MIREPTTLPFCSISWPFALSGKSDLRDARDRERVDDAEQHGRDDGHQCRGDDIAHDVHRVLQQTLLTTLTPGEAL